MNEKEPKQMQNSHDISIALIQKDIEYIKQNVTGISTQIALMDKNYAKHEEILVLTKAIEDLQKNKVNASDFEPIKTTLYRINWMIITAIVGGLIALVVKVSL